MRVDSARSHLSERGIDFSSVKPPQGVGKQDRANGENTRRGPGRGSVETRRNRHWSSPRLAEEMSSFIPSRGAQGRGSRKSAAGIFSLTFVGLADYSTNLLSDQSAYRPLHVGEARRRAC